MISFISLLIYIIAITNEQGDFESLDFKVISWEVCYFERSEYLDHIKIDIEITNNSKFKYRYSNKNDESYIYTFVDTLNSSSNILNFLTQKKGKLRYELDDVESKEFAIRGNSIDTLSYIVRQDKLLGKTLNQIFFFYSLYFESDFIIISKNVFSNDEITIYKSDNYEPNFRYNGTKVSISDEIMIIQRPPPPPSGNYYFR